MTEAEVGGLAPETEEEEEGKEEIVATAEASGEEEATPTVEEVKAFIGEMSEEDVLGLLGQVDGLEGRVYESVSAKVYGKFGDVGRQLKALQEREFKFDPAKLNKLKEVDEGIAEALASDLSEAFSGQSFDSEALAKDMRREIMNDFTPYIEQRLLEMNVPDMTEIVQSDAFEKWYYQEAKQEVRDTFENWDNKSNMDGLKMAQAFSQFKNFEKAKETKVVAKKETLARSVEPQKASRKAPASPPPMSEEEAFNARVKETTH